MFAPIYAAAFQRGIAPALLDASPLHVIGWAIAPPARRPTDGPETAADLADAYLEREALAAEGRLDEFYVADTTTEGLGW